MGWQETLKKGFKRAGEEAKDVFDKGKSKVGELQTEMQMDGLAKKLGYLTFDTHRGRQVDEELRTKYLTELSQLEDQLEQAKAEAAAKAEAEKAAKAAEKAAAEATKPAGQ